MVGHIFLSYSSQDRDYVRKLSEHLRLAGVRVWVDSALEPGDTFEAVIRARIAECAAFVVVLTPAAAASVWVSGEVLQAVDAGKLIIPLMLEACDLPVPLRGRQYEDVTGGRLPGEPFLARLRAVIGADTDAPAETGTEATPEDLPTMPPFTRTWPPVVTGGALRLTLEGHTRPVYAVAIAPDGQWVASAGDDGTVRIWDVAAWGAGGGTPPCRHVLAGHTALVHAIAIAPDGRWMASVAADGNLRLWDVARGRCHAMLRVGRTTRMALSTDFLLVTVHGATVTTWNLASRGVRSRLEPEAIGERPPAATALAMAPDGTWLATGCDNGAIYLWDVAAGAALGTLHASDDAITAVAIAADGTLVAAAGDDGTLRTWNRVTLEPGATYVGPAARRVAWTPPLNPYDYRAAPATAETVWDAAIAPDATWLATAESDRLTRVWETSTGDVRAVLRARGRALGRRACTLAVAIAPDGTWLVSGDSDGIVRVWDVSRGGH